jgi:hypothetical protein
VAHRLAVSRRAPQVSRRGQAARPRQASVVVPPVDRVYAHELVGPLGAPSTGVRVLRPLVCSVGTSWKGPTERFDLIDPVRGRPVS